MDKVPDQKIESLAAFWKDGSDGAFASAIEIYEKTSQYALVLFQLHLSIEKAVKSKIVLKTGEYAPYSHNLVRPLNQETRRIRKRCCKGAFGMDIFIIKDAVLKLRSLLIARNIAFDGAILFGSYAKGKSHPESDVDLAILSMDFGKDRIAEGVLLQTLLFPYLPHADAVPISSRSYLDLTSVSPLLDEIKKTGICLI
jgi:uncharacterized protein